ncbi:MAG: lytic transglycosylase domain-containing protein [Pseudomonadota bacterium]|nr:lytic transglycosylase domain-containing protein [Pseudomonadota bacterium]
MASPGERIYLIENDADVIHLSDRAQGPDARLLIEVVADVPRVPAPGFVPSTAAVSARRSQHAAQAPASDLPLAGIVRQAAIRNSLEPELLHAMIAIESGGAARAVSPRGAQGLMQLMPATARDYGVSDPFDPRQNIGAGARHLRRLLDRFGQDKTLALAAYNAGPEAVARHHGQIPPNAETMAYVPRVLQRFAALQQESQPAIPGMRAFP